MATDNPLADLIAGADAEVPTFTGTVQPDEDGMAAVKHGLGVLNVVVSVVSCDDPDAAVGAVNPIDDDEAEIIVTTTSPVTVLVVPFVDEEPAGAAAHFLKPLRPNYLRRR